MDPEQSQFYSRHDSANLEILRSLTTPWEIQRYLDSLPYVGEELNRTPLRVMQDRQCHCLDGGMLGALCLRRLGYPARILDLIPEPGTDDDHVLAIFRHNDRYGAVAKSNYVGLRFREPVYRSLRELVMSYFEVFFNVDGLKTLRGYTRPPRSGSIRPLQLADDSNRRGSGCRAALQPAQHPRNQRGRSRCPAPD